MEINSKMRKVLTCTQDNAKFLSHSWAAGTIPGRSTVHQQRRYLPQKFTLQSHAIQTQASGPPHLYMSAVVAPGRKLDASEGDRTLERHLDGRLFHTILAVKAGSSWDGTATEVPLNYGRTEQDELSFFCFYLIKNTVILRNIIT